MSIKESFSTHRYVIQTVDPVHIGTGGMRLGRVDNSIVREPGTKLPKIPGTSLNGAIRHYAAYRYGKRQCAGKDDHCGLLTCPICYTFGSVKGKQSYSGVVNIGDGRILFFPVYSMAGPVWVTGVSVLSDFGIKDQVVNNEKAKMASGLTNDHLNLGWLMVEKEDGTLNLPLEGFKIPDTVKKRIVLVSDKFFSQIVNSNLEVRTSVSINPETGAAEEGALFTYEAIPRAAFLWFDLVVDDYRDGNLWKNKGIVSKAYKEEKENSEIIWHDNDNMGGLLYPNSNKSWEEPSHVITAGLEWAEHLGIGGMGTRGFGRIRLMARKKLESKEVCYG